MTPHYLCFLSSLLKCEFPFKDNKSCKSLRKVFVSFIWGDYQIVKISLSEQDACWHYESITLTRFILKFEQRIHKNAHHNRVVN